MRLTEDLTQCESIPPWARELRNRSGAKVTSFGHTLIQEVAWDANDQYLPLHDVLQFRFADGDGPVRDNEHERHFAATFQVGSRVPPASPPLPSLILYIDRSHFDAVVQEHFSGSAFPQVQAHDFLRGTPHGRGLYELARSMMRMIDEKADLFSCYCLEIALIKAIALAPPSMLSLEPRGDTWGPMLRRVELAALHMTRHLTEPFELAAVAKAAGCSPRTLSEAFRTYLQLTPLQFHLQCRLEAAYADLSRSQASVTETAAKFGFENLGRFARAFRERFGINPSQVPPL